jgi:glycerophosphoryl diester phosphodiesterase
MSPVEQLTVPIVIAHRGASGYLPEHTLAGYAVAVMQGADFVEPDLVMTRDGQLVCRHDHVLNLTTDVASRPEFADRKTTKIADGVAVTGWFSEDFTLAEIEKLRAVERMADIRPANTRFDGQFEVPTLAQVIDLVQALEQATGRPIGIYPEVKHPTYFCGLGLSMEEPLVDILRRNGYEEMRERVYIQSFEVGSLKKLRGMIDLPLIQLLAPEGKPYDVEAAGGSLTYDRMATRAGLAEIATYADGVGPEKCRYIIRLDPSGSLDPANATPFVADAHALGLKVHPYTFRGENRFLPANYRSPSGDPNAPGDLAGEICAYLATGIDGFFTDQPHVGVRARDAFSASLRLS